MLSTLVEMFFLLFLCPMMLGAGVQTLTIDTQLGTSMEDCFERISIGEQIPTNAIYRNVSELTTRECETICKQDKQCQSYDYGVGAKGNATCNLSMADEKEVKEKRMLLRHPDYDVYVRRLNCEQSPPKPIQALSDDPNGGPAHKPIFRPDDDDRRPLNDDLKPFESFRPEYKPIPPYRPNREPYRPDDYTNSKPVHDMPPSYGDHKPAHVPYVPEKPSYQPDPYDELHFKPHHERPQRPPNPALWRPDPYHPPHPDDVIPDLYGPKPKPPLPIPPYVPTEKPIYHYFVRPPKKPHQTQIPDSYGQDQYPNNLRPEYGHEQTPNRPYDYPLEPYDKPLYSYNSHYAGSYGHVQEPIYVEIVDPPRPYKPAKPERPYEQRPINSYGGFGQDNQEYSQSQSNGYGINQSNHGQRPHNDYGTKPQRPSHFGYFEPQEQTYSQSLVNNYGNSDQGYGQKPHHEDQGFQYQKPQQAPINNYGSRPSYDNGPSYSVTEKPVYEDQRPQTFIPHGSYFESMDRPGNAYGEGDESSYYQPPFTPGYNRPNDNRPSYGSDEYETSGGYGDYKNNRRRPSYNQSPNRRPYPTIQSSVITVDKSDDGYGKRPTYGNDKEPSNSYGNQQSETYGEKPGTYEEKPAHHRPSSAYGESKPSYEKPASSYGEQKPDYDRPNSYGEQRPTYAKPSSSYGDKKPVYEKPNSYGEQKPVYEKPNSYGEQQPAYEKPSSSYGEQRPDYEKPSSSYGEQRPDYEKPSSSYGEQKPAYEKPTSYGEQKPAYEKEPSSSYGKPPSPSYGNEVSPSYGNQPTPTYTPAYENPTTAYGQSDYKNTYTTPAISESGYKRPDPAYNRPDSGYNRPDPGYLPNSKPVYENPSYSERPEEPSYIYGPNGEVVTSRPVAVSSYGKRPEIQERKKTTYEACFRRVLAGHRALRSFVRRVLPCEALQDCTHACGTERQFHCESFNYRLDPTFRGKGLCELMTRPIEAFNIRRDFVEDKDYDFYEIDRNSLEPNCPETLGGPGLLHSGFLSSKPSKGSEDRWRDRNDWQNRHYYEYDNRFYDDRRNEDRFHTSGRRKYQDQDRHYIPYQIGIPSSARSDDVDHEKWGKYGGNYGGYKTYYKDRNDYHKSINYWRINNDIELPRDFGVKPIEKAKFDPLSYAKSHFGEHGAYEYGYGPWKKGRWNPSGSRRNSINYEGPEYHKTFKPSHFYGPIDRDDHVDSDDSTDCSSRRRAGMSLGSGAIRRSLHASNVLECEAACFEETEFKCVSYSYRYSSPRHSDNCFLSERPYRGLQLSVDTESDVYAMPHHHTCSTVTKKPWVESECFWHVRSGVAIDVKSSRALLTVAGLGACEAECIRASGYFCRGFSFRFDAPTIGDNIENCILTSSPPTSLGVGQLSPNSGHELYARGNYGRGCEPALYDIQTSTRECYLQHDKAARLLPAAVKGRARVSDERGCGHACTNAPFKCYSFSYNNKSPHHTDNCFLSEVRLFDLELGVDYEHSIEDWLFAYDLFNSECWKRKEHGKEYLDESSHELPRPLRPTAGDHPPSGPGLHPPSGPALYYPSSPPAEHPYITSSGSPSGPSGPSGASGPSGPPIYKPPVRPDSKPGYLPESRPDFTSGGFKPGYPPPSLPHYPSAPSGPAAGTYPERPAHTYPERPAPFAPGYRPGPHGNDRGDSEDVSVSWRHYTVSGFPCRKGSTCARNTVAGHWSCEPEGGEIGSWDYCCAPTHRCGYSEGFNKPWCYVGPNSDQWRPCSEKYYPYHQHGVPHPSQENTGPPHPWSQQSQAYIPEDKPARGPYIADADRKYWDDLYKNGPSRYYDKYGEPLPGYSRVPETRPQGQHRHHYNEHGSGRWMPVNGHQDVPGLGAPRYWPVAYLHKGPPPNMTYFRFNETYTTTTERYNPILRIDNRDNISSKNQPIPEYKPANDNIPFNSANNNNYETKNNRDEKNRNISNPDKDIFTINVENLKTTSTSTTTTTTTEKVDEPKTEKLEATKEINRSSEVETIEPENFKANKETEDLKGIDDKLEDFSKSIEILDISDAEKNDKANLKSLEVEEEKQIEAIGRLLAHRRGGKLVIEKRSQNDLIAKGIAIDNSQDTRSSFDFDFPPVERRGKIQKVTKEEIERERNKDKSLEVSETTYVRPPRVLSTTDNIRKAIINGKVFYDATVREQRDIFSNSTRVKNRSVEPKITTTTQTSIFGKKQTRKILNPVRRVRRIYRRKYNPGEVRKRLLEKEKTSNVTTAQ